MRSCPLCTAEPRIVGSRYTTFSERSFTYGMCDACDLGLVVDPREDYADLYDEAYYAGRGADWTVDYVTEMSDADSIRQLEWRGFADALGEVDPTMKLLDFGGGLGGLTLELRSRGWDAWAFESEGYAHDWMLANDVPLIDRLPHEATFDVVFAVEVMEHLVDPLPELSSIRRSMRPGGRLIISTGNLARADTTLDKWTYASVPEVHVTFWSPRSWTTALERTGFAADAHHRPLPAGVTQYKMLKTLPDALAPLARVPRAWSGAAAVVDRRYGVSEFPEGVAVDTAASSGEDFFNALASPPGVAHVPEFLKGWRDGTSGESSPYLVYVDFTGSSWSDDLEEIHEESSRDHFMDVLTRDSLLAGLSPTFAPGAVLADLGCSTGYLLEDLERTHPTAQLVGVDVVGAGLRKAHASVPGAALLLADVCDLPIGSGTVDGVVSANMLEHVADDRGALREMRRILKPGAIAALVVPFGARLVDYYDEFLGHERRYARGELAGKAREAGLEVVRVGHLGSLLYPPFWLVKKRNRVVRGSLKGAALQAQVEKDIAGTTDSRIGALATRAERSLTAAGVNLPVGIRELVVVRRSWGDM